MQKLNKALFVIFFFLTFLSTLCVYFDLKVPFLNNSGRVDLFKSEFVILQNKLLEPLHRMLLEF